LCAAAAILPARSSVAEALPNLGANIKQSSVSGLSSGAFMAVQIEVAHSGDIVGSGIVAGGPYACAESASAQAFPFWPTAVAQNAAQALYRCMKTDWGAPDPAASVKRAKELAAAGDIDPLDDVKDDNVYLFSGNEEATVTRPVVEAAKRFFERSASSAATSPSSRDKAATPSLPRRAVLPAAFRPRLTSATATTTRPRRSSPGSTAR
jgi:hypothetical protein